MTESEFITEIKWLAWEISSLTNTAKVSENPAEDGELQAGASRAGQLMSEHESDYFELFRKLHLEEHSRPTPQLTKFTKLLREYSELLSARPCFIEHPDKWKTIEGENGEKRVVENDTPQPAKLPLPAEILRAITARWIEELEHYFPDLKEAQIGPLSKKLSNDTPEDQNGPETGLNWRKFLSNNPDFIHEVGNGGLMSKPFELADGITRKELAQWLLEFEWFYENRRPCWIKIDGLFVDSKGKTIKNTDLTELASRYKFKKLYQKNES